MKTENLRFRRKLWREPFRRLLIAATQCEVNEQFSRRGNSLGFWPCRTCIMDLLGVDDQNDETIPLDRAESFAAYLWVRGLNAKHLEVLPEDIEPALLRLVRCAVKAINEQWRN